jgi:hypothetical protein
MSDNRRRIGVADIFGEMAEWVTLGRLSRRKATYRGVSRGEREALDW